MALRTLQTEGSNPEVRKVLLTAPIGTAAFNINTTTLHSTFFLPLGQSNSYKKLGDDKRNTLRAHLYEFEILIIDEVSMVGSQMMMTVDQRLREIKGIDEPFGRTSVLAFGDFYPLAPVCQRFVFEESVDIFTRLAGSLWEDHFHIAELTEIMRQKDDKLFAQLLNLVREGLHTKDDVMTLMERTVDPNTDGYPTCALHVFTTKSRVDEYNKSKLADLPAPTRLLKAVDKKPNVLRDYAVKDDPRFTGGLPGELHLAVGARVMLTRNLDVQDGLVNGALGTVVGFCGDTASQQPKAVMVDFDNENVGSNSRQSTSEYNTYSKAVAITPIDT
ncbi:ATP-dependent DNA helicase PIF1-like [Diadema antillarum]|uniref:ATP-dependent DNA helicase PIF1-like n=1 Tax=Diadema antillarum TaxID=105358 RepID=UPI003A899B70